MEQGGAPPSYVCWFIIPINYIDITPESTLDIGVIGTNLAFTNWGTTLKYLWKTATTGIIIFMMGKS